jgi:hypothetical protein
VKDTIGSCVRWGLWKLLEEANRAIWNSYRHAARRNARRQRLPTLIRAIDELLFELEELNLTGVDRVPAVIRERSAMILDLVPSAGDEEIRVRFRVSAMIDTLFRAQELVLRAKDPNRPAPAEDDEEAWTA